MVAWGPEPGAGTRVCLPGLQPGAAWSEGGLRPDLAGKSGLRRCLVSELPFAPSFTETAGWSQGSRLLLATARVRGGPQPAGRVPAEAGAGRATCPRRGADLGAPGRPTQQPPKSARPAERGSGIHGSAAPLRHRGVASSAPPRMRPRPAPRGRIGCAGRGWQTRFEPGAGAARPVRFGSGSGSGSGRGRVKPGNRRCRGHGGRGARVALVLRGLGLVRGRLLHAPAGPAQGEGGRAGGGAGLRAAQAPAPAGTGRPGLAPRTAAPGLAAPPAADSGEEGGPSLSPGGWAPRVPAPEACPSPPRASLPVTFGSHSASPRRFPPLLRGRCAARRRRSRGGPRAPRARTRLPPCPAEGGEGGMWPRRPRLGLLPPGLVGAWQPRACVHTGAAPLMGQNQIKPPCLQGQPRAGFLPCLPTKNKGERAGTQTTGRPGSGHCVTWGCGQGAATQPPQLSVPTWPPGRNGLLWAG